MGGKAATPLPLNPPSAPEKERGRGALLHGAAESLRFLPLNSIGRDKKQILVFDGIFVGKKELITNCSGQWLLPRLQTPHPIATTTFKQLTPQWALAVVLEQHNQLGELYSRL